MENIIINFILIGEVWSGKSFLGNFLSGKKMQNIIKELYIIFPNKILKKHYNCYN